MHKTEMNKPRPFLKWIGGKKQLLKELKLNAPTSFNDYYEPFVGGGAFLFEINHQNSNINDINKTLICAYQNLKNNPNPILKSLKQLSDTYYKNSEEEREEMFYEIRENFNNLDSPENLKTAYLIFLNKTAYNGMYRENSKGKFNTPFGRYKKPLIYDEDNLVRVSQFLKGVNITNKSFEKVVRNARENDFIYFDPPYHPVSSTSSFTNYSGNGFDEFDQVKLKEVTDSLSSRGVKVMLSNSYTPFILDLYKDYKKVIVYANRSVNCKATGRGKIKEILILNY